MIAGTYKSSYSEEHYCQECWYRKQFKEYGNLSIEFLPAIKKWKGTSVDSVVSETQRINDDNSEPLICSYPGCYGEVHWHYLDIDQAYSPRIGTCSKCGKQYIQSFPEEREQHIREWNKEMAKIGAFSLMKI